MAKKLIEDGNHARARIIAKLRAEIEYYQDKELIEMGIIWKKQRIEELQAEISELQDPERLQKKILHNKKIINELRAQEENLQGKPVETLILIAMKNRAMEKFFDKFDPDLAQHIEAIDTVLQYPTLLYCSGERSDRYYQDDPYGPIPF